MVGDKSELRLWERWGRRSAVRLAKVSEGMFTTDLHVITKPDEISKAVKQAIADGRGKEKPKEHSVVFPLPPKHIQSSILEALFI